MSQEDESLDRIEAALERIGRHVEQPDPVAAEVAQRLDAMITRLRAGLAGTGTAPEGAVPEGAEVGTAEADGEE